MVARKEDAGFLSRWSRRKVLAKASPDAEVPPSAGPLPAREAGVAALPRKHAGAAPDGAATRAAAPGATVPAMGPAATAAGPWTALDTEPAAVPQSGAAAPAAPPPPTLDDVALLTPESDFAPFVARDVDPNVQRAALKKLFSDPHFNVMDGLDTYIDDYGKPDPLPEGMLAKMAQSQFLGLFSAKPEPAEDADAADAAVLADASAAADTAEPSGPAAEPADPTAPTEPAASPDAANSTEPLPDEDTDLRLQPHDAAGPGRVAAGAGEDAGRQH